MRFAGSPHPTLFKLITFIHAEHDVGNYVADVAVDFCFAGCE